MSLLSLSAALALTVQGTAPFEVKFLEMLFKEIENEEPANPALLIDAAELCQQMLSSDEQIAIPSDWRSLIEDEPSFLFQRGGVLLINLEEDEETHANCMILSKPASQEAIEEAFFMRFETSAAKPVEMGALKLPGVSLSDATYDYEFVYPAFDLSATSPMKDGLILGISYKVAN